MLTEHSVLMASTNKKNVAGYRFKYTMRMCFMGEIDEFVYTMRRARDTRKCRLEITINKIRRIFFFAAEG